MYKSLLLLFFSVFRITNAIAVIDLHLLSTVETRNGLGWPRTLHVVEGHDALLKLVKPLVNQSSCVVTTGRGVTFDVASPPSDRYEAWGDGNCGVRIKNVAPEDEGRWRMTAIRADYNITGFSEVYVVDSGLSYDTSHISLEDGESNANINLTVDSNRYCVVHRPFAASTLVSGQCVVTLDKTTRAVQGSWGVDLGLLGRVAEYHVTRHVAVEAEHLDVGFIHDTQTHKLHLYCNILNTHKNITYCRFQKTSSTAGFNVVDGLSDGHYSYYGEGFVKKHCGLTVENPTDEDLGSWRCSMGVQEFEGTHIVQRSPMQALITVTGTPITSRTVIRKNLRDNEIRSTFAQRDRPVTIDCRSDVPLSYCWFQSPDARQYSPVELSGDGQEFWYSGESLMLGQCSITFASAVNEHSGLWTCHMAPNNQVGLEQTDRVEVRITGPLAANQKEVAGVLGGALTLHCHSSSGNRPLGYCRFLSPSFVGINLDSTITQELAILDRFYYTANRSLDHGDCSLTIDPLYAEDFGTWTCAALVDGELLEASDTVKLFAGAESGRGPRARASIIGVVVGIAVLSVVLAGVLWHRYGKPIPMPWRSSQSPSQMPMVNLGRTGSVNSASSGGSSINRDNFRLQ